METNNLINELYAILINPNLSPDLKYFRKYELQDENLMKIQSLNSIIAQSQIFVENQEMRLYQQEKFKESSEETFELVKKMKNSLNDTLESSRSSQSITTWMYVISFCLGLVLIVAAVVFAAMGRPILAIAFGAFGMVDIVAHFIADPPARLQESRSNYVQLIGLTLAWFKETINNDSCIASSSILTKEALDNYNSLSESYVTNTGKFFNMMEILAEPSNKKINGKKKKKVPTAKVPQ